MSSFSTFIPRDSDPIVRSTVRVGKKGGWGYLNLIVGGRQYMFGAAVDERDVIEISFFDGVAALKLAAELRDAADEIAAKAPALAAPVVARVVKTR
jgi:hypothetical protein